MTDPAPPPRGVAPQNCVPSSSPQPLPHPEPPPNQRATLAGAGHAPLRPSADRPPGKPDPAQDGGSPTHLTLRCAAPPGGALLGLTGLRLAAAGGLLVDSVRQYDTCSAAAAAQLLLGCALCGAGPRLLRRSPRLALHAALLPLCATAAAVRATDSGGGGAIGACVMLLVSLTLAPTMPLLPRELPDDPETDRQCLFGGRLLGVWLHVLILLSAAVLAQERALPLLLGALSLRHKLLAASDVALAVAVAVSAAAVPRGQPSMAPARSVGSTASEVTDDLEPCSVEPPWAATDTVSSADSLHQPPSLPSVTDSSQIESPGTGDGLTSPSTSKSRPPNSLPRGLQRQLSQLSRSGSASHGFRMLASPALPDASRVEGAPNQRKRSVAARMGAVLGRGAFGTVRICLDEQTGELLAAKVIECDPHAPDVRATLQQLEAEVRIMRRLGHPSLVGYVGSQKLSPTSFCIFMEYVPGGSIASLLEAFGSFSDALAARYIVEVLDGVMYLHEHKIIHRDIKGANILLSTSGLAKLADFGSARLLADVTSQAKGCFGTIFWMAPEVFQEQEYSFPVDVWSLGATVMEMLTAAHPWRPSELTPIAFMRHVAATHAPPWDVYAGHFSPAAHQFLQRCMRFSPDERPRPADLYAEPFLHAAAAVTATSALQAFHDAWMLFLEDTDPQHHLQASFDRYCAEILQGGGAARTPRDAAASATAAGRPVPGPACIARITSSSRAALEQLSNVVWRESSACQEMDPAWQEYLVQKDNVAQSSIGDVAMQLIKVQRSWRRWSNSVRNRNSLPSDGSTGADDL